MTKLLTGANGGVGLNLSTYLLETGERDWVFHYRHNPEDLIELLKKHDLDPAKHMVQADLVDEAQVQRMISGVVETHGGLYGLVNNAGATSNSMVWRLEASDFLSVLHSHMLTTFLMTKHAASIMRAAGKGRIVNISSVTASKAVAGASHYCAAKAGVEGFTRATAQELAPKGITVNAIALGYFSYGMIHTVPEALQTTIKDSIPLKKFGERQELGGLIHYLMAPEGSYATGQVFHLNGGLA